MKKPETMPSGKRKKKKYRANKSIDAATMLKDMVSEGDFVLVSCEDGIYVGIVQYVMTEGMLGIASSDYSIEASMENPAVLVRTLELEEDEGIWEESEYLVGAEAIMVTKIEPLALEVEVVSNGYKDCGCPTCEAMNVDCENCPVCSPMPATTDAYDNSVGKAEKPNYANIIDEREGGSDPSNKELYSRIVAEAKAKFDVYPSAVANAWVSQEYKKRGGTYKSDCCPEDIAKQAPCWDGYVQRGMKPKGGKMVPNCVPAAKADDLYEDEDTVVYETDTMSKADGYSPPAGAGAAARKAIKFKEDGKANGAGTAVGWTRAGQLARGETVSLSTVKRMYSYFSRHEVDKKGKDWANQSNPSNGYIMWLAWGGDAGFSWARGIVEREKSKAAWVGSAFSFRKP